MTRFLLFTLVSLYSANVYSVPQGAVNVPLGTLTFDQSLFDEGGWIYTTPNVAEGQRVLWNTDTEDTFSYYFGYTTGAQGSTTRDNTIQLSNCPVTGNPCLAQLVEGSGNLYVASEFSLATSLGWTTGSDVGPMVAVNSFGDNPQYYAKLAKSGKDDSIRLDQLYYSFYQKGPMNATTQALRSMNFVGFYAKDPIPTNGEGSYRDYIYITSGTVVIEARSCTTSQANASTVQMDSIDYIDVKDAVVGDKIGDSQIYSFSMTCDSGVTPKITITDHSDRSNTSTVVSLTSDSSAAGLGYSIGLSNLPTTVDRVKLGNSYSLTTTTTTANQEVTFDAVINYVRTSGTVNTGTANAIVNINFIYK